MQLRVFSIFGASVAGALAWVCSVRLAGLPLPGPGRRPGEGPLQLRRQPPLPALVAQQVDGPVAGRAEQPAPRAGREPAELPGLQGPDQRVLHRVLDQRQVARAEDADQRGDHPPRLAAEEVLGELTGRRRHIGRTARTSTAPSFS